MQLQHVHKLLKLKSKTFIIHEVMVLSKQLANSKINTHDHADSVGSVRRLIVLLNIALVQNSPRKIVLSLDALAMIGSAGWNATAFTLPVWPGSR